MSVAVAQPIAGVSANREAEIETIYSSVAAGSLGQIIGMVMGIAAAVPTVPLRLIAYVLLGIPMSVLGVLAYGLAKLFGKCFVLTNRSIRASSIVGGKSGRPVPLGDIAHIAIATKSGYAFHRVGDVVLENAQGQTLLVLPAITFPERVKNLILDTQTARQLSDESLAHIQARKV